MNNKLIKFLGILAAALGGLLVAFVVVLLISGNNISDIFNFSRLFGPKETTPVVTVTAEQTPEASPAESGDVTVPGSSTQIVESTTATVPAQSQTTAPAPTETNESQEPADPVMSTVLRVGVSELKGNFDPFQALSEGDANVMKLVGLNLLTRDRTGRVIMMATEGEYGYFNGERYLYTGPADISGEYDEEADEYSFTLKLKDGIYFSDGVKLTVDDLIFNLYVRLQPNFPGDSTLRSLDIVGLKNYYYNNSLAESTVISDEELAQELEDPGKETQDYIRMLIRETLQKCAQEAQRDWTAYQTLGYGNSAEEYFYKMYGIDLNYSLLNKSLDQVCEDVIESYGLDYQNLAAHYAVDEHYFDGRVNTYTRELLLYRKMQEGGGEPVDYISGIVRLGDYAVKLRVHGKANQAVNDLFDMVIAPLHYYGDKNNYNYEKHQFGFRRGDYQMPEEAVDHPLGAGPYIFCDYDGRTVTLKKNENYYKATSDIDSMLIRAYGSNVLEEVANNELDIVVLKGNRTVYNTLRNLNRNGQLIGDKIYVEEIFDLGYSYMGINAEKVKVGEDPYSEASRNLRRGLLTSMAVYRDLAYENYFGSSMKLIQYPVSPFFGLEPEESSEAFIFDIEGNRIYQPGDDALTRYAPCIEAVKQFLIQAGFVYNEGVGKFITAPQGASLRYEVMLCGDLYAGHPSYGMLAYTKSVLHELGITLDVRYISSQENMLVNLYLGEADMWSASWKCIGDPNFELHYGSDSGTNLFRLYDEELDGLLETYTEKYNAEEYEEVPELAAQIMARVREEAVELPCYTLVDYLVYNVKTIDVTTLPTGHSLYWSWMDDVAFLDVFPTPQQEAN